MHAKKTILHADDFGIGVKINEGIQYLFEKNILTSCSVMANGPAFEHAAKILNQNPRYDAGMHLCLTFGTPLLQVASSLADEQGRFYSLKEFIFRYITGRIRLEDIRSEWDAQISLTLDSGIMLSHIDSHHHIHALPGLFDLALSLCNKYNIPGIRAFRQTARELRASGKNICLALLNPARRTFGSIAAPDNIAGLSINSSDSANPFIPCLDESWQGVRELVCHPGFHDESLTELDSYVAQRLDELRFLDSDQVAKRLKKCMQITYRDIGAHA